MSVWTKRFLELAEQVASWSKDPSTKVGCVIVDSKRRVLSVGYNGFPRGICDTPERLNNKEIKHTLVCHAEANALDNAPINVEACTLYCTLLPCNNCAKSIIQNGITCVVTYMLDRSDKRFNFDTTLEMFREAGVELYLVAK